MCIKRNIFIFFSCFFLFFNKIANADVNLIRWYDHDNYTRIVVEADLYPEFNVLSQDADLNILIKNSDSIANGVIDINSKNKHNKIIKNILIKNNQIKLKLNSKVKILKKFVLPPVEYNAYRLVIDVQKEMVNKVQKVDLKKAKVSHKKFIIAIDPGHGGKDRGAKSSMLNLLEKNLTLKFAILLKNNLEKNSNFKVLLTRDKDVFLRPEDRVKIVEKSNADLLISLHADFHQNSKMRGLSVYTRSDKASDKEAELLAEQNNNIKNSKNYSDKNVEAIVNDIISDRNHNLSIYCADIMVEELSKNVEMLSKSHRFANFKILDTIKSPALIIELGYLSNPQEENLLSSKTYQTKLVTNIANSITRFYDSYIK